MDEAKFKKVEQHFIRLNEKENIRASEFELLTATAFQLFTDHKIDIGVVEVGMGGSLDATNILNNQIVSVISKIAHDHQTFLGNTLEEIASHKAGILRPNVPYIVNPANEWIVQDVIERRAKYIGAGPHIDTDSDATQDLLSSSAYTEFARVTSLFQRQNVMLAFLASKIAFENLGLPSIDVNKPFPDFTKNPLSGRCEKTTAPAVFGASNTKILVDGAHNEDAGRALQSYVLYHCRKKNMRTGSQIIPAPVPVGWPVTWVIAMTAGRDPLKFLKMILRPGDRVVATTFGPVDGMPWVKPMAPEDILEAVKTYDKDIVGFVMPERGAHRALMAAKYLAPEHSTIVMTGSLYLVGDFMREKRAFEKDKSVMDVTEMDTQERNRVNALLSQLPDEEYDRALRAPGKKAGKKGGKQELEGDNSSSHEPKGVTRLMLSEEKKQLEEEKQLEEKIRLIEEELRALKDKRKTSSNEDPAAAEKTPSSPKLRIRKHFSDGRTQESFAAEVSAPPEEAIATPDRS